MSPEVALLVRAALLGLLVLAVERFGKRRQAKRAATERTIIRLPATRRPDEPLTGRPLQVTVRPRINASTASVQVRSGQVKLVQLEPTPAPELYDGHVTEKRAA